MRPFPRGGILADPLQRLQRAPVGAHLMGLTELVLRVHARSARPVPEPPVLTGAERATLAVDLRRPGRVARAEPNAPQLIRIVKTPYALSPGWARRRKVREVRERLVAVARLGPITLVSEVSQRPASTSPAGTRPRGTYPALPRDLVARYLKSQESDGGAR